MSCGHLGLFVMYGLTRAVARYIYFDTICCVI
jgi:hypothetical protein